MRKTRRATIVAVAITTIYAAGAVAGTKTLEGTVVGDPNADVTVSVKTNNKKKPKSMTVRVLGVDQTCVEAGTIETGVATDKIALVKKGGAFVFAYSKTSQEPEGEITTELEGTVHKKAKTAAGTFSETTDYTNGDHCETGPKEFSAAK